MDPWTAAGVGPPRLPYQPTHRKENTVNKAYALAVLERAIKTAAQAALLVFGADQLDAMNASWADAFGFAAGGFVLSLLTSIATSGFGPSGPSATTEALTQPPPGERGAVDVITVLVVVLLVLGILLVLGALIR